MRNGDKYEPSLAKNTISTVCKVPGTSLSPGRLKWALKEPSFGHNPRDHPVDGV